MNTPYFTLAVVATRDGFIARAPDDPPQSWASAEEQTLFFAEVEAADWAIMGRHTHEAADKPNRRRIVMSSQGDGWRRPSQLWLDPAGITPWDLPNLVSQVHPLRKGLILGGTRVHDWFHTHGAINCIKLTIEPLRFGSGLPMFTGQASENPVSVCKALGYWPISEQVLNPKGTRLITLISDRVASAF